MFGFRFVDSFVFGATVVQAAQATPVAIRRIVRGARRRVESMSGPSGSPHIEYPALGVSSWH